MKVVIGNGLDQPIEVLWEGWNGMGIIAPGAELSLNTWPTHQFIMRDVSGVPLNVVVVEKDKQFYNITTTKDPQDIPGQPDPRYPLLKKVNLVVKNKLSHAVKLCTIGGDQCELPLIESGGVQHLSEYAGSHVTIRNASVMGFPIHIIQVQDIFINLTDGADQIWEVTDQSVAEYRKLKNITASDSHFIIPETVRFHNRMGYPIKVCWNGHKCDYGTIMPNEHSEQNSFVGHAFGLKSVHSDQVVEIVVVLLGVNDYYIHPMTSRVWRAKFATYSEALRAKQRQIEDGNETFLVTNSDNVTSTFTRQWDNTLRGPARIPIYTAETTFTVPVKNHLISPDKTCSAFTYPPANTCRRLVPAADKPLEITLEPVSTTPRIYVLKDFLSTEETDHLMDLAKQRNRMVVSQTGDEHHQVRNDARRSSQAWLHHAESEVVDTVIARVLQACNISLALRLYVAEDLQVVRYKGSHNESEQGYYKEHHDYFPPEFGEPSQYGYYSRTGTNRVATLLFYLNSVEEGGRTAWPMVNKSVKLSRGSAVLFYSMLPDGNLDMLSKHKGENVLSGEKWISNVWLWDLRRENQYGPNPAEIELNDRLAQKRQRDEEIKASKSWLF